MTKQIVTANRLTDGVVVYLAGDGTWTPWISDSHVVADEDSAAHLLDSAQDSVTRNEVVEPYLIDVIQEDGIVTPVRYREVIRAKGPSVHPELWRATERPAAGGDQAAVAYMNGI